jgi:hypothetical protein
MTAYLTLARYKLLATIPASFIDEVETVAAGFTDAHLEILSRWLDSKLAKRYAAPFAADSIPSAIEAWLARLVTPQVMLKRGVNATDEQWQHIVKQEESARAEVQEAADSENGLYDLPLRQDTPSTSGIAKGFTKAYSEQSPYVQQTLQAQRGLNEDNSGSGSST